MVGGRSPGRGCVVVLVHICTGVVLLRVVYANNVGFINGYGFGPIS